MNEPLHGPKILLGLDCYIKIKSLVFDDIIGM